MRVDQYLWCIRLFKSRSLAGQACKKSRIMVNSRVAKPSREIYPADCISMRINQIYREFEVLDIPKSRVGTKLVSVYAKENTPKESFEYQELQRLSTASQREKGTGRPTKKERRAIDSFQADSSESSE